MMIWKSCHPRAKPEMLGYLPDLLSESDPRSASEQINSNYSHGGGWRPFKGFDMLKNGDLTYPGDPPTRLLFEASLRREVLRFYEHSWLVIMQPNGKWEVSRVD